MSGCGEIDSSAVCRGLNLHDLDLNAVHAHLLGGCWQKCCWQGLYLATVMITPMTPWSLRPVPHHLELDSGWALSALNLAELFYMQESEDDMAPASRVRQRYEKMFRDRQGAGEDSGGSLKGGGSRSPGSPPPKFLGTISSIFAPHLQCVQL